MHTNTSGNDQRFLRQLGEMEMRMALFHEKLNGSTQGVQVIYFNGDITAELFRNIASHIHAHYQALQCKIEQRDDTLWFSEGVNLDQIEISYCETMTSESLDTFIHNAVDTPIDANKSLWRLQLVKCLDSNQNALILSAHHSIIDANGMHEIGNVFFLSAAHYLAENTLPELTHYPLQKPIDDLLHDGTPPFATPSAYQQPHDGPCPIKYRKTHWQTLVISKEENSKFTERCQQDKLKPHSVISAALCQALADAGLAHAPFVFGTAVSLRFLQDSNPEYQHPLGCYMAIASNMLEPEKMDLNALAEHYNRELMQHIMLGCLKKLPSNLSALNQGINVMQNNIAFTQGAGITNMAEVGIQTRYGDLIINDYRMLANRVSANFSMVAHCYEFNGSQIIGLVYPSPCLSDATAVTVKTSLRERLLSYADGINLTQNEEAAVTAG
ncbi:hypothetical protein [Teredinibacter sp. KSP-S5-2]|uniref:hypothetical protein n=1 Tax=Teredinibacter sp. KSP-S5-2 TaxID=3034506 RepID=UPI00293445EA|nr:hypothetical protein [Teredinibacter sp. KSP-S5-2]WNO10699.1 hypothetical protein P5V12_05875 [Teredinibacter sp. KSP-S5-2]